MTDQHQWKALEEALSPICDLPPEPRGSTRPIPVSETLATGFLIDAETNLMRMARSLARIAADPAGEPALRSFHHEVNAMKSGALSVGLAELVDLTRATERVLHDLRRGLTRFSADLHESLQCAIAVMGLLVPTVRDPRRRLPESYAAILAQLHTLHTGRLGP
jgi:chemotaxis protein histidine kinase CheA